MKEERGIGTDRAVEVCAVVVTHDSAADLPRCVRALRAGRGDCTLSIVVSDCGSSDGVEEVSNELEAHFLPGANDGWAGGANRGAAASEAADARYLLFVNPDTELVTGTLEQLVALADAHEPYGVFGPRLLDRLGQQDLMIGFFPSPARIWAEALALDAVYGGAGRLDKRPERYGAESPCDWLPGAFLLIRRELFDELAGFSEGYFLYWEDVDFCRRAAELGRGALYLPQVEVRHAEAWAAAPNPWRHRLLARGSILYARKWHGRMGESAARAGLVVLHLRGLARAALRRRGLAVHAAPIAAALGPVRWWRRGEPPPYTKP
jgi:N-acetylglucosaminyl-diphospho-decaprenol L-rhamnosyltransferase